MNTNPILEINNLTMTLGHQTILEDVNLSIERGEIIGIAGGSGSGKTTLLNGILMLKKPNKGSIKLFNQDVTTITHHELLKIQRRIGVLFQQNALFSSLTVLDNLLFPLKEHTDLDNKTIRELAFLKLWMVGLPNECASKYPSELSGGMQKRVALARAIILDPDFLLLDEPTAGLDPKSAEGLDELILNLRSTMNLTIMIVTHDLDTLWTVTDRVAFLGQGKVLCIERIDKLVSHPHKLIQAFFNGPRGRVLKEQSVGDYGNPS